MLNYNHLKKIAFKIDPETAHHFFLNLYQKTPYLIEPFFPAIEGSNKYRVKSRNLNWKFPIGLAAGFDKDALVTRQLAQMGFGSIEVGTITPKPQEGNPRPRIWRYPKDESLRNAMGFPGFGMESAFERIQNYSDRDFSLGINLGKNKVTSEDQAWSDYLTLYEKFHTVSDYLVINLSSPNTPGLRDLQKAEALETILKSLEEIRKKNPKPLFLKISPDLNLEDLNDTIEICKKYSLSGIIATNTTIRPDLGPGGISGKYLKEKSRKMRKEVLDRLKETPDMDLIGVGGIDSFQDVLDFWNDGGKFVQVYTGFIYKGSSLLHEIKNGIDNLLKENQCHDLDTYLKSITKV